MTKVIKFESSSQRRAAIEEAACAWLARLEAGASEEELQALSAWLFESREHVEIFFEASAAWDQLTILLELSEVFPLEKYRLPPAAKKSGSWFRRTSAAAVVVLLAAVAGMVGDDYVDRLRTDESLSDVTIYKTDVGQRSTVTLSDGSEIVLNTNTMLEVRYSGAERRIVLDKGEAFFTVSKDALRPFRVVAGSHVVEAIGTEFAVQRLIDDSVEVMVKEGVVGFRDLAGGKDGESTQVLPDGRGTAEGISLVAGEIITTEGSSSEAIARKNLPLEEIESRLSWQQGMLFFLDRPLDEVIREINRYTTTIIVADEDVKDIRVDGSFRVGDIDALLLAMEQNFGLDVIALGNEYVYLSKVNAN